MRTDDMITFMDALLYTMEGESASKAIENQEKRGQQAVVRNQRLPKKSNEYSVPEKIRTKGVKNSMSWEERHSIVTKNNIEYTKKQYEKMGIIIVDEYDDLFWTVELPEDWKIEGTDHAMWNSLFDNKGRQRASFFYKAAFYDRDAFINFNTRFHIIVDHIADASEDYEIWAKSDYQGIIKDGDKIIFSTECVPVSGNYIKDDKIKDALNDRLIKYMHKNYPDYKNINAYWD